jgi:hypothetical protein
MEVHRLEVVVEMQFMSGGCHQCCLVEIRLEF